MRIKKIIFNILKIYLAKNVHLQNMVITSKIINVLNVQKNLINAQMPPQVFYVKEFIDQQTYLIVNVMKDILMIKILLTVNNVYILV